MVGERKMSPRAYVSGFNFKGTDQQAKGAEADWPHRIQYKKLVRG